MSVSALSNRSLATVGGIGAFAAVAGGAVYFKAAGIMAVVGGMVAVAGVITALAAVAFSAYKYYYPTITPQAPNSSRSSPVAITPQISNLPVPVSDVVSKVANTQVLVQCILKFLPDEEILSAELVSKSWKRWASGNTVWKYVCDREGIPPIKRPGLDPKKNQPSEQLFYKAAYQHLYPIIFGPKQYSDHLRVKVHGDKARIDDDIHEVVDQLNPGGQKNFHLIYWSRAVERTNSNGTTTVAQTTIKLLDKLVQAPGVRNPTEYSYIWQEILDQRGDEVLELSGWRLISTGVDPATRNASYANQVNTISALGARPPKAIEAIALNFFTHARFKTYPYGQNPWTYSRTSTTVIYHNVECRVIVGHFGPSGLLVHGNDLDGVRVGMAAAFSCGSSAAIGT